MTDRTTEVFVISDLHRLWLNIDLPEKSAALAKPGESVNFTLDGREVGIDFVHFGRVAGVIDGHDGHRARLFVRRDLGAQRGFVGVATLPDLQGLDRVSLGRRPG